MSDLAARTQAASDGLKDAFYALDVQQRDVRMHVESYSLHLPKRINKSGLVPRFRILDADTEALIHEYLDTLDRFPLLLKMRPEAMSASCNAYVHLRERIERQIAFLVQFLADYDAEFRRVSSEVDRLARIRAESAATVVEATRKWQDLRSQGFESPDADRALAKARIAGRAVEGWTIQEGTESLEKAAALVASFGEEVGVITAEFPTMVGRVRSRRVTLRTRLDAIETRSGSVADDLQALRREFSIANFRDLEGTEQSVLRQRENLVPMIGAFEGAAARGSWPEAMAALGDVEEALDELESIVGAPRSRLQTLRSFKADPQEVLGKARFALRDAQQMVVHTPGLEQRAAAEQLDQLAVRLTTLPRLLEKVHPDYLHVLNQVEQIRVGVKQVVDRVRRHRAAR